MSVRNHHQAIRCCYEIVCGIHNLVPNVGFTSGRSVVELSYTELGSIQLQLLVMNKAKLTSEFFRAMAVTYVTGYENVAHHDPHCNFHSFSLPA